MILPAYCIGVRSFQRIRARSWRFHFVYNWNTALFLDNSKGFRPPSSRFGNLTFLLFLTAVMQRGFPRLACLWTCCLSDVSWVTLLRSTVNLFITVLRSRLTDALHNTDGMDAIVIITVGIEIGVDIIMVMVVMTISSIVVDQKMPYQRDVLVPWALTILWIKVIIRGQSHLVLLWVAQLLLACLAAHHPLPVFSLLVQHICIDDTG